VVNAGHRECMSTVEVGCVGEKVGGGMQTWVTKVKVTHSLPSLTFPLELYTTTAAHGAIRI